MFAHIRSSVDTGLDVVVQQLRSDDATRWVALIVLGINVLPTLVFSIMNLAGVRYDYLNPMEDRSVPEYINYAQTLACAVLLVLSWLRSGKHILLALAAMLVAIVFDDFFRYHERAGVFLTHALALPALPGLRAQDSGELLAMAVEGLLFLPILGLCLLQRDALKSGEAVLIVGCMAGLVFFAAGVDVLHVVASSGLIGLIEDTGEMLSMACAFVVAFCFYRRSAAAPNGTA